MTGRAVTRTYSPASHGGGSSSFASNADFTHNPLPQEPLLLHDRFDRFQLFARIGPFALRGQCLIPL